MSWSLSRIGWTLCVLIGWGLYWHTIIILAILMDIALLEVRYEDKLSIAS